MTPQSTSFYITGGNVPPDSLSYVPRQADTRLYTQLLQGEFCYVLTARQMGKSSLMTQTVRRLREQKVVTVILDLSSQGYNLTVEQWYNGLIEQLGRRLKLGNRMEDFCLEHEPLSPLQRWQKALREVVLTDLPDPVVIFIDEIDVVRSLPFSTDEFFAAIRSCYNERAEDPEYRRLSFCLLGVAAPTDLIRNPDLTPFNIGIRIDLDDFTEDEAALLQQGLGRDSGTCRLLMHRIYYWTGGHPYLTQRLCKAVAEDTSVMNEEGVDRWCHRLFFAPNIGHRDDNLTYVRQRMLPEEERPRADLLTRYRQILHGKPVPDHESEELVSKLKLSGAVCAEGGLLRVRNRIYARMFDLKWVIEQMPDAEKRRQKKAEQRGMLRAAYMVSISLLSILSVVAALLLNRTAHTESNLRQQAESAAKQTDKANKQMEMANRSLQLSVYAGDMLRVNRYCDTNNLQRADTLLAEQQRNFGNGELPFEWRYYWRQCHLDQRTIRAHENILLTIALTPDGKTLITGSHDKTVKFWDLATGHLLKTLSEGFDLVFRLALSPDGRTLAVSCEDGKIHLIDLTGGKSRVLMIPEEQQNFLAFAPDGRTLFTGGVKGTIKRWKVKTQEEILPSFPLQQSVIDAIAVSRDGKTLAIAGSALTLYNTVSGEVRVHKSSAELHTPNDISSIAFSPDGNRLAVGMALGNVTLLEARTLQEIKELPGHDIQVSAIAFAPDGRILATAGWDFSAHLYDLASGKRLEIQGHQDKVNCTAFTPDGKTLVTAGNDGTAKIWEVDALRRSPSLTAFRGEVSSLAFSSDNRTLFSCGVDKLYSLKHWDIAAGRQINRESIRTSAECIACSSDGRWFATRSSNNSSVLLWDAVGHRQVARLQVKPTGQCIVVFSPDSRLLAIDDLDDNKCAAVRLWNVADRKWEQTLPIGKHYLRFIVFSPDSSLLAAPSVSDPEHALVVWDLRKGSRLVIPTEHHDVITAGAFSPDGITFASCSWDSRLTFWDAKTWKPWETILAHRGNISSLSFSADSKTLATGGEDRVVKLWNVKTRKEVAILSGHNSAISRVLFSPDGNTLASGDSAGKIILWRAAANKFVETSGEK